MVSIEKLKLNPEILGKSEFNLDDENIYTIYTNEKSITINFKKEDPIKSIRIPIGDLIEIKLENNFEWDVRLVSFNGDISIYYKQSPYSTSTIPGFGK